MKFFKPVIMTILSSILVCSLLIFFGAPREPIILGGFTAVVLSMGKSIYDHFRDRIKQNISPFLK